MTSEPTVKGLTNVTHDNIDKGFIPRHQPSIKLQAKIWTGLSCETKAGGLPPRQIFRQNPQKQKGHLYDFTIFLDMHTEKL